MTELERIREMLAGMPELEAIRRDDPRGQPSPIYRALIGLCQSDDGYVAVVRKDGQEFDPSMDRCERMAIALAACVNYLRANVERIEQMEAALKEIAGREDYSPGEDAMIAIARAALQKEPGDEA